RCRRPFPVRHVAPPRSPQRLRMPSSLRNVDPAGSEILVDVERDLDKAGGAPFSIVPFVHSIHARDGDYREAGVRVLVANRFLKRVSAAHLSVAREEDHLTALREAPEIPVAAVGTEANLGQSEQPKR